MAKAMQETLVQDKISGLRDDALLKFFIGNMNKLSSLLIRENKLLNAARLPELYGLLEDKKNLSDVVQLVEDRIVTDPEVISEASPKVKAETREAYTKLTDLMVETKANLEIHIRVSDSILDYMQNSVVERRKQDLGYDKNGKMPSQKVLAKDMPSLSLVNKI